MPTTQRTMDLCDSLLNRSTSIIGVENLTPHILRVNCLEPVDSLHKGVKKHPVTVHDLALKAPSLSSDADHLVRPLDYNDITSDGYVSSAKNGDVDLAAWNNLSMTTAKSSSSKTAILIPWYELAMGRTLLGSGNRVEVGHAKNRHVDYRVASASDRWINVCRFPLEGESLSLVGPEHALPQLLRSGRATREPASYDSHR